MGEFISLGTAIKTDPKRVAVILDVVMDFFEGTPPADLADRVKRQLGAISGPEFAYAAQILAQKDDGSDPFEAKMRRELLMHEVFDDALDTPDDQSHPPGHPLTSFAAENARLRHVVAEIRAELAATDRDVVSPQLLDLLQQLAQVHIHYLRKENQLFPYLESKGFDRPSTVMWAQHDAIRGFVKRALRLASDDVVEAEAGAVEDFVMATDRAVESVIDMITKEEQVLFPTSLELLSLAEWADIRAGDDEIGYCLIEQPPDWAPDLDNVGGALDPRRDAEALPVARSFQPLATMSDPKPLDGPPIGSLQLSGGYLTAQQLNGVFRSLSADITYVDENDRVRFYNKGEDRVFPRSKGIIGREVRYCHPPKSVHVVLDIVEAFRSGEQDTAEFWIQMGEAFVYIRYFAMRDRAGQYRGVLEVSQEMSQARRPIGLVENGDAEVSSVGAKQ